jgi:hypothetical protein
MNPDDSGTSSQNQRKARLAASLRENLKRRKAQQRSRTSGTGAGAEALSPSPAERRPEHADKAER